VGSCSRASGGIRSTTRGQYCAFWNIIGACDDAIPSPSMIRLLGVCERVSDGTILSQRGRSANCDVLWARACLVNVPSNPASFANVQMCRFERGLRPRNLSLGGGSAGEFEGA